MDAKEFLNKFRVEPGEVEFEVRGVKMRAQALADASSLMLLEQGAKQIAKMCKERPLPDWQPFLPAAYMVIRAARFCEELMIEPKFTFAEGLEMGKTCGGLIIEIASELLKAAGFEIQEREEELLDELKNA